MMSGICKNVFVIENLRITLGKNLERITVEKLQCEYKRVNEFESKKQVCFKHDWKSK